MVPILFIGNTCQYLALALIIGGMLALGAFTAPVLFSHFARPDAGAAMTIIFRRYDLVLTVALGLLVLGEGCRWWVMGPPQWSMLIHLARFILFAGVVATIGWGVFVTNPKMEALQNAPGFHENPEQQAAFQQRHVQSEKLYKAGLLLALLLLLATTWETSLPYLPIDE